ncbi:helix-turn-helix domain-containing protein [Paenibacillus sacheonensis]|uniref:Helix-turn-helix domain-containing protein n=1 Tax=Paenibacillus sacheonensis TaxID=742054 RepID=A0A7X5BZM2_9BACL|nr:helix-turn-helix domain-containing protein [Paenibacillus sacheonensis]MBM7567213.1 AraC-like DNA-binding protein [Paenibacillus sacheonensis]NBC70862.1 helix-turn-helix domain-containing protein [Paenibacillus sacheonensis]
MFRFTSPPMPHYITSGKDAYSAGDRHADRSGIGVFDLLVTTRGCLFLEEDGLELTVPAGHFAILRPDRSHRTSKPCGEETHFHWLHFQTLGSWSEVTEREPYTDPLHSQPYLQIETFVFHVPRSGELPARETMYEWLEELQRLKAAADAGARFKQQGVFQQLLFQLQEEGSAAAKDAQLALADEAAAFLRRSYREQVSYKELSEQLHFHANYIALCMKKAFGCTPLDYLTRYRIEQAKQLLIHTGEPIGSIAEATGFATFSYFVRCFGKHTGTKPKAFRQRFRT